jgi:hypothetical protein
VATGAQRGDRSARVAGSAEQGAGGLVAADGGEVARRLRGCRGGRSRHVLSCEARRRGPRFLELP